MEMFFTLFGAHVMTGFFVSHGPTPLPPSPVKIKPACVNRKGQWKIIQTEVSHRCLATEDWAEPNYQIIQPQPLMNSLPLGDMADF